MREFTVLAVGDVFGQPGREFLKKKLSAVKSEYGVDFCVVNGENAADGNGINPSAADDLFAAGADVVTTGNHAFQRGSSVFSNPRVLRPANYHRSLPGAGFCVVDCGPVRVLTVNMAGRVFTQPADNPFDRALECLEEAGEAEIKLLDFHAEATAEKRAMGFFLAGRYGFVFGTHTHVQTADEQILPGPTAYITDLGMTGVKDSLIGLAVEPGISRLREGNLYRPAAAEGPCVLCAAAVKFTRDGKPLSITRITAE